MEARMSNMIHNGSLRYQLTAHKLCKSQTEWTDVTAQNFKKSGMSVSDGLNKKQKVSNVYYVKTMPLNYCNEFAGSIS
jgi:hypothetical protein